MQQTNTLFTLIITVYNAEKYIERCLRSVAALNYPDFRVVILDDASTDSTPDKIKSFQDLRFEKIFNPVRVGQLANIAFGIQHTRLQDGEDVIVTIDGDDMLATPEALNIVKSAYDKGAWMTYGQMNFSSNPNKRFCKKVTDTQGYRKSNVWCVSQLRTFRRSLWDKINPRDLCDENGAFFLTAGDAAFLYPLLEMCGSERSHLIETVLYTYTDQNPISDTRKNRNSVLKNTSYIKSLPEYKRLDHL